MYIKVKITAGAKVEKVAQKSHDHYNLSVKEKAENNRANKRVIELISEIYKTKKVKIISGHHSQSKILAVGD